MRRTVLIATVICGISILFSFGFDSADASYINCPDGVDLTKYPICNYVDQWNESEEFAFLVNERFNKSVQEFYQSEEFATMTSVNNDVSAKESDTQSHTDRQVWYKIQEIHDIAENQIRNEHPGLEEKGLQMKMDIYEALGNLDWFLNRIK